jgi:hypothetical protein
MNQTLSMHSVSPNGCALAASDALDTTIAINSQSITGGILENMDAHYFINMSQAAANFK